MSGHKVGPNSVAITTVRYWSDSEVSHANGHRLLFAMHALRARMASLPVHGRGTGQPSGQRRPDAVVVSSRRQREDAERLCEEGGRAASLCAGLFVSSSPSSVLSEDVSPVSAGSDAPTEPMSASPVSSVSFVPEMVMTDSVEAASCVVGTPGMDEASPDVLGVSEGGMLN